MKLTPRENEVIILLAEGFADKEIALRLKLSARTVQSYLNSAVLKLNARNRTNAVAIFIKAKYQKS